MNGRMRGIVKAIQKQYPNTTSFDVTSSDQNMGYGYLLVAVSIGGGASVNSDTPGFDDFADDLQERVLDDLDWGEFGDNDGDSTFAVSIETGRIDR